MIASVLTTAHWHEPDSQAVACIRTIGLPGPGNLPGAAQNSQRLARGRGPAGLLLHPASVIQRASLIAPIPAGRPAYGRLVETSALVQKDDAMADDSTTIELSSVRTPTRSPATRWRARGQHWRSSNVNALTIGAHEPRSTLRRRSRMEPSGPRRYVTARGRHTGRLRRPAMQDRLRRATLRARPARGRCGVPPPPAESYSGQAHPRIGRSCRTSVRTLPPETIPPSEPTTSRSPGSLRLPSWWTS